MKYTLFLTQQCNLACDYCYVSKNTSRMSLDIALRIVNFAFEHTPQEEEIEIGFFGGEPLLEYPLLAAVTQRIEDDVRYDPCRVKLGITTNGTLLTLAMLEFFDRHNVEMTISCDGPPHIQNRFRHFKDGSASAHSVERAIRSAVDFRRTASVNAVYGPQTIDYLPEVVDYFTSLGVREVHLNADFSAYWSESDVAKVPNAYEGVAQRYLQYYREHRPQYISLLDSKITVMLRGGYQPLEMCRMGVGEFAFTPSGQVYPCERLAFGGTNGHSIGSIGNLVQIGPLQNHFANPEPTNPSCVNCSLRAYCINWCGCCNFVMTGFYNRVSPFLCTSEKTSLRLAVEVVDTLESELGPTFLHHLGVRYKPIAEHLSQRPERMTSLTESVNLTRNQPHR